MSKKKKPAANKDMVGVTVLLKESHHDKLKTVADGLKAKGFVLAQSLEGIGTLTGHAPAESIADLSSVPGVAEVEKERTDYHTQE